MEDIQEPDSNNNKVRVSEDENSRLPILSVLEEVKECVLNSEDVNK